MAEKDKPTTAPPTKGTFQTETMHSIYRTTKKVIQNYSREMERYNRYKTSRSDMGTKIAMDHRGSLIDLYEACVNTDAHMKSVIRTLESQVLGERYMLARENDKGKYIKDVENTKKIQGTQFIKIIKGILEAKLFGYTLIELGDIDKKTGKLAKVELVERRNVLPDQKWVVKRQNQTALKPGYDLVSNLYKDHYILINNDDLGMFETTTPIILAKKFTFSNYVGFSQTYGQPIIQGKTSDDDQTSRNQLAQSIANSAAQRVLVTGLEEELTIHALAMSNSEKIYTSLIDIVNSEVSNLVLGSESMAGATQSYVGSTNAHQDIFRDRIEVYREFIENIMNEEVIPRLIILGMIDEGLAFKYSNNIEMSNDDRIKLYDMLLKNYNIAPEEIEKEFGIIVEKIPEMTPKTKISEKAKVNFLTGK